MEANTSTRRISAHAFSFLSALDRLVERHATAIFLVGLAVYLVRTIALQRQTPLQWDEFLSYAQAQLPSFSAFWSSVKHNLATNDPPLHPLLMFLAVRLPLPLRWAMRLPSFVAYGAFLVSVFVVLRRRTPASVALVGFAVPMLLPAYNYASTARPYALLLGFSGWAFALWQHAAEQQGRRLRTLLLLFICLSGAILTHYFGASAFVPIIAGEAWRTHKSHRVDRPIWLTLALAATSIVAYIPFVRAAYSWRIRPAEGVVWEDLTSTYGAQLTPILIILLMVCILIALIRSSSLHSPTGPQNTGLLFHPYECVAIAGVCCIPALIFIGALLVTHNYMPRYAIFLVLSTAILLSSLVQMLTGSIRGFTSIVALALLLEAGRSGLSLLHPGSEIPDRIDTASLTVLQQSGPATITTPNWDVCARLFVFGPPSLRPRLLLMFSGTLTQVALSRVLNIPMESPVQLLASHSQVLLIDDYNIHTTLANLGARITFVGRAMGHDVDLVESPRISRPN